MFENARRVDVTTDILTFLENKRLFGRKVYIRLLIYLSMDKKKRKKSIFQLLPLDALLTVTLNRHIKHEKQCYITTPRGQLSSSHRVSATPLSCPLSYETLKAHSLFDKSYLSCRVSIFHHCWQRPIITIEQQNYQEKVS